MNDYERWLCKINDTVMVELYLKGDKWQAGNTVVLQGLFGNAVIQAELYRKY